MMSKIFRSAIIPARVRRKTTGLPTCMYFGVHSLWTAGFYPLNFPSLLPGRKLAGFYRANYHTKEKFSSLPWTVPEAEKRQRALFFKSWKKSSNQSKQTKEILNHPWPPVHTAEPRPIPRAAFFVPPTPWIIVLHLLFCHLPSGYRQAAHAPHESRELFLFAS